MKGVIPVLAFALLIGSCSQEHVHNSDSSIDQTRVFARQWLAEIALYVDSCAYHYNRLVAYGHIAKMLFSGRCHAIVVGQVDISLSAE